MASHQGFLCRDCTFLEW